MGASLLQLLDGEEKDKRIESISHSAQPLAPRWRPVPAIRSRTTHLLFELSHALLQSLILSAQLVLLRLDREGNKGEWAAGVSSDRADPQPAFICSPPSLILTDLDPLQESLRLRVVRAQAQARALLTESSSRQSVR